MFNLADKLECVFVCIYMNMCLCMCLDMCVLYMCEFPKFSINFSNPEKLLPLTWNKT